MVFLLAKPLIRVGDWDCAMFAAFVAAAHPVFAEIVPCVTSREEVLTSALIVGTIWAFVRYRTAGKSLEAVCVWLTLALLTKESGVVALLLVLGYESSMLDVPPTDRSEQSSRIDLWGEGGEHVTARWPNSCSVRINEGRRRTSETAYAFPKLDTLGAKDAFFIGFLVSCCQHLCGTGHTRARSDCANSGRAREDGLV
jgi:hypothetical protein